jgi:hypothetical protein
VGLAELELPDPTETRLSGDSTIPLDDRCGNAGIS